MTPEENSAGKAITKNTIRRQVIADFSSNVLQKTWRPSRPTIPRFPTVNEAVNRLAELEEYQNALTVVTKAGNTLKDVRLRALKDRKKLLVPIPFRSDTGTFYIVEPPETADDKELLTYITRLGLHDKCKVVSADSIHKADIIILGSVAVNKQGHRIGSGSDYCDLELGVMAQKGMITKDTVIATIVHDTQVMESFPEGLFGEHDVGVGLIVTPSQIIRVSPPPPPPPGILWKLLTKQVLQLVPVLGELHDVESKTDPSACELKVETVEKEIRRRDRIFRPSKPRVEKEGDEGADRPRPRQTHRKSTQRKQPSETGEAKANGSGQEVDGETHGPIQSDPDHDRPSRTERNRRPDRQRRRRYDDVEKQNGEMKPRSRYGRRREYQIDFSLSVRNLASDVRVRDLKKALVECQVKPAEIMWRGPEGYAVLHFAREGQEENTSPTSMDGMITTLRNLNVSTSGEDGLVVEPYNRVTRIEVTDQVSSV